MSADTEALEDWGAKECLEAGGRAAKLRRRENLPLLGAYFAVDAGLDLFFGRAETPGPIGDFAAAPVRLVLAVLAWALAGFAAEAFASAVFAARAARERPELRPLSPRDVLRRLPALTAAGVIPFAPFLLAALPVQIAFVAGGPEEIPAAAWILAGFGAALVIATLPLVLSLSLADKIILLEGRGLRQALGRSRALTKGRRMMAVSLLLRTLGIGLALGLCAKLALGAASGAIRGLFGLGPEIKERIARIAEPALDAVIHTALLPWFSGAWLFLAASLGAGTPAAASAAGADSDEEPALGHEGGAPGQADPTAAELDPQEPAAV